MSSEQRTDIDVDQLDVTSLFIRALSTPLQRAGYDVPGLYRQLGIDAEQVSAPGGVVSGRQYMGFQRLSWQLLGDEFCGLTSQVCPQGSFSLMVRYLSRQPTLRSALIELERFYTVLRQDVQVYCTVEGEQTTVSLTLTEPALDEDNFLRDFLMVIFHRTLCWLTDTRIVIDELCLSSAQQRSEKYYSDLFDCPRRFEQPANSISFSSKYLALPIAVTQSAIRDFLKHSPADMLVTPGVDVSMATRVKGIALAQQRSGMGFPDFLTVAGQLCLTPQTLRRRLQQENSSYQQLKDRLRRDIAIDQLLNEDIGVADIGVSLGFAEPASFTRAFKQWTGLSPAEYRAKVLGQ